MGAITWTMEHWVGISALVLALVRAAECYAELTPTQKDDNAIVQLKQILKNFFVFDIGA